MIYAVKFSGAICRFSGLCTTLKNVKFSWVVIPMTLLAIKHIQFRHGERHKLLVSAHTGIPLYYPSLFITTHVRAGGFSVSTVQGALAAIKVLYAWQANQGINLEALFSTGRLLQREEITSLVAFSARLLREERRQLTAKVHTLKLNAGRTVARNTCSVGAQTQFTRISTMSKYLGFLAETLRIGRDSSATESQVSAMVECLNACRPKVRSISAVDRDERGLDIHVVDQVLEYLWPDHPQNPFSRLCT